MRALFLPVVVCVIIQSQPGCTAAPEKTAATTPAAAKDCPPALTMVPRPAGYELAARAAYRASVSGGAIQLHAAGEFPTAGWDVAIAQRPTRIFPPQFELLAKKPEGSVAQVITPFQTCVKVAADSSTVRALTIFDADGSIEVRVERAP